MKKNIKYLLALIIFLAISGCGGGSKGTGGEQLDGRILTVDGDPIQGAQITLISTGDSAISQSDGSFQIETDLPEAEFQVVVEVNSLSSTLTITGVSAGNTSITTTIEVDLDRGSIVVKEIKKGRDSSDEDHSDGQSDSDDKSDLEDDPSNNPPSEPHVDEPEPSEGDTDGGGVTEPDTGEDAEAEASITEITEDTVTVEGITFFITQDTVIREEEGNRTLLFEDLSIGMKVHINGTWRGGQAFASYILANS